MQIRIQVLIGLKQFIARDIRDEQMPLVEDADETWLATLWGGITLPCLITGGHNHERRVADEVLDVGRHGVFHFRDRPAIRVGIAKSLSKTVGFNGYCHGSFVSCARCTPIGVVLAWRKTPAERCSLGICRL